MLFESKYEIVCTKNFADVGLFIEGRLDCEPRILARPYGEKEREYGGTGTVRWYKTGKFITRSEWNEKANLMFAPQLVEYYGLKNKVNFDDQEETESPQRKEADNNMIQKEKDLEEVVSVNLTKSQCKNLAEYIEFNFIDYVRNDDDIDNILYLADMCEAYKKLLEASKGEMNE